MSLADYPSDMSIKGHACPPAARLSTLCDRRAKKTGCPQWLPQAHRRRIAFFVFDLFSIFILGYYAILVFAPRNFVDIRAVTCLLFIILLSWIASNFWVSAFGLYALLKKSGRFDAEETLKSARGGAAEGSIAVVMPICNEGTAEIFARMKVLYRSIEETGRLADYHFFVLSDSTNPDKFIEEELLWAGLCEELRAYGRLFYHRRKLRIKKKHGNIRFFCKLWGEKYKYMLIVDADSIMTGKLINDMASIMEARPEIGILQSMPFPVGGNTIFSNIHKFAAYLYGRLNVAGLNFLQLGDSVFWGHNAVIRTEPYACYCVMPASEGRPPFGGEILSHDFLEAAFMRKAGWEIWLLPRMAGSFEETPKDIREEWSRDRRWLYGDLQHIKFIFSGRVPWPHRFLLFQGAFFYFSSLLWLVFLVLISSRGILNLFIRHEYFPRAQQLFPIWPIDRQRYMGYLVLATLAFLFMPKLLGLIYIVARRASPLFGGITKLMVSTLTETFFFIVLAPVKMVLQSEFILKAVISAKPIEWNTAAEPKKYGPADAWRLFGPMTIAAVFFGLVIFFVERTLFGWSLLVLVPMLISMPFSLYTADEHAGRKFAERGLFTVPIQYQCPPELLFFREYADQYRQKLNRLFLGVPAFVKALTNKWIHRIHAAFLREKKYSPSITRYHDLIKKRFRQDGVENLSQHEKQVILNNKRVFLDLFSHQE